MKGQVQVYRNLHKTLDDGTKVYSVRNDKGIVEDHVSKISLLWPIFRVGPKGNQRVREEKKKNVHAYMQGTNMGLDSLRSEGERWQEITYNPYKHDSFVLVRDESIKVREAKAVEINEQGVWVFNPS
jgi:hypothetical protein